MSHRCPRTRLPRQDLSAWQFVCAAEQHFADHYTRENAKAPLLAAWKSAIAERPRIKE